MLDLFALRGFVDYSVHSDRSVCKLCRQKTQLKVISRLLLSVRVYPLYNLASGLLFERTLLTLCR